MDLPKKNRFLSTIDLLLTVRDVVFLNTDTVSIVQNPTKKHHPTVQYGIDITNILFIVEQYHSQYK